MASVLLAGLCLTYGSVASADEQLSAVDQDGVTMIRHNGVPVLEYRSQPNPMKLYVSRWFTPQGTQVLRDSPHDHVHHRALMYAIGIDGCDFWSEVPANEYGRQVPVGGVHVSSTSSPERGQVVLRQSVEWTSPAGQVLAVESRRITAHVNAVPAAALINWALTLTPTDAKPEVELWGRHYFGLGMRFVETMDTGAEMLYAGDAEGVAVRGSEKVTRATWCAVRGNADGKPVTIAMFDAPTNPRHPATWFTMDAPFAYVSATLNLDAETLVITRQQPLRARYGVACWDGTVDVAEIERAYRTWLELPEDRLP